MASEVDERCLPNRLLCVGISHHGGHSAPVGARRIREVDDGHEELAVFLVVPLFAGHVGCQPFSCRRVRSECEVDRLCGFGRIGRIELSPE